MKEILAFIRMNKMNDTKKALAEAGFPGITVRNCLGRGRKSFNMEVMQSVEYNQELSNATNENLSEATRLIPKRFVTIVAQDEDVEKIVDIIMGTNSTGHPGDGKIFVIPAMEAYRVRDGKQQDDSDSY